MYDSLRNAVNDLEVNSQLIRVKEVVSGYLEAAEIHRRILKIKGLPFCLKKIEHSPFQAVSNLYGTYDRTNFLFRHTLAKVQSLMAIKADPASAFRNPGKTILTAPHAIYALPKNLLAAPVVYGTTTVSKLP